MSFPLAPLTYNDYIKSDDWKKKRQTALIHYHFQCCFCGRKYELDVHHKKYDNLFNEPFEDLTVLCRAHHTLFHDHIQEMKIAKMQDVRKVSVEWERTKEATQDRILLNYYLENPDKLLERNDRLIRQLRENRLRREGVQNV